MLDLTSRIALFEIGRIAGIEEREAQDIFEEAHAGAERLGDRGGHAFLLTSFGRLCGLAGDVARYLGCAERALELAAGADDTALAFEMHTVLAHARLAVGRLDPARVIAEPALAEDAGLREALARSTAPAVCRIWCALASAYLVSAAEAQAVLEALLGDEQEGGLEALYGTRAFLCEVLRLRGDLPAALAHGRRAVESALESAGALAAELGADPYRRMADLERARLSQARSVDSR